MSADCWLWSGAKSAAGYGQVRKDGRLLYVHRLMCEIFHGASSKSQPYALHSCDTPSCINPTHLRWGSPTDNATDRTARQRSGPRKKKLNDEAVKVIRYLAGQGVRHERLANAHKVSRSLVTSIVNGSKWEAGAP